MSIPLEGHNAKVEYVDDHEFLITYSFRNFKEYQDKNRRFHSRVIETRCHNTSKWVACLYIKPVTHHWDTVFNITTKLQRTDANEKPVIASATFTNFTRQGLEAVFAKSVAVTYSCEVSLPNWVPPPMLSTYLPSSLFDFLPNKEFNFKISVRVQNCCGIVLDY
ncbi:hypothetical protein CDAR_106581 [Caerostris darwini]|uniref:Uncharacterized protein n=1 Tax=Caerostris darwini TaxID=1538125 RepID=A0AAV4Q6U4_9ARAC|nr:hypothetical protein CDAR_106581 [Caerostris darwini]